MHVKLHMPVHQCVRNRSAHGSLSSTRTAGLAGVATNKRDVYVTLTGCAHCKGGGWRSNSLQGTGVAWM
jgi:hypothetical protein